MPSEKNKAGKEHKMWDNKQDKRGKIKKALERKARKKYQ